MKKPVRIFSSRSIRRNTTNRQQTNTTPAAMNTSSSPSQPVTATPATNPPEPQRRRCDPMPGLTTEGGPAVARFYAGAHAGEDPLFQESVRRDEELERRKYDDQV